MNRSYIRSMSHIKPMQSSGSSRSSTHENISRVNLLAECSLSTIRHSFWEAVWNPEEPTCTCSNSCVRTVTQSDSFWLVNGNLRNEMRGANRTLPGFFCFSPVAGSMFAYFCRPCFHLLRNGTSSERHGSQLAYLRPGT